MHESKTAHRHAHYLLLLLLTLILFTASLVLGTVTLYAMNTAAKTHHAGIVVQYGNGKVINRCIEFSDDNFSGLDLLNQTGLDVSVDASNAMGAAVCKIGKDGCDYPGATCFCQCQGSSCTYWSYWNLQNGAWQYSSQGPSNTTIHNGDVDGWIWGAGTLSSANPPTLMTFDQICTASDPTETPTDVPPTNTRQPTDTPTGTVTETAAPTFTATNTPTETAVLTETQAPAEMAVATAQVASATKKPRATATFVAQAEPTETRPADQATDAPPPSDTQTPRPTLGQPKRTPTHVSVAQASDSNSTDNGQETEVQDSSDTSATGRVLGLVLFGGIVVAGVGLFALVGGVLWYMFGRGR
jgi:hypothetical protein